MKKMVFTVITLVAFCSIFQSTTMANCKNCICLDSYEFLFGEEKFSITDKQKAQIIHFLQDKNVSFAILNFYWEVDKIKSTFKKLKVDITVNKGKIWHGEISNAIFIRKLEEEAKKNGRPLEAVESAYNRTKKIIY